MNFGEYVLDWFSKYLESHEEHPDILENLFDEMNYEEENLDEGETKIEYLQSLSDADEIYEKIFGYDRTVQFVDDLPDTETFLNEMFSQCVGVKEYSFGKDFIEDMATHAEGYRNPVGFFKDLAYGGCTSGLIGMLISNDDCKELYIKHIDSMEAFKEEYEGELGEPIRNKNQLPHYTFVCWFCYEEFAYNIGRELFPNTF